MKTKLLTAFLFLVVTSTQTLAARPSIAGLDAKLDTLINDLVVCPSNSPTRFVDNGDGTICDHQTGLMWEQKNASDGTPDFSNPRDADNNYSLSISSGPPDGTAYTEFLARLNGTIAGSGPSGQLGGYSDWRLPTVAELQSILDCSFGGYPRFLCIDPVFDPTHATFYWSSTSVAGAPDFAWEVLFGDGEVNTYFKSNGERVRAVRGGR